jgi:hypothetical protein
MKKYGVHFIIFLFNLLFKNQQERLIKKSNRIDKIFS